MAVDDVLGHQIQSCIQRDSFLSSARPHVFVLGGLSFVGRNLIRALQKAGYGVKSMARTLEQRFFLRSLGCTSVGCGDSHSLNAIKTAAKGCLYAVHCASGFSHCDVSRNGDVMKANSLVTQNIIQACRDLKISKLVVQSSDAVLFDGRPLCDVDESYPYPPNPIGACARSLRELELVVIAANGEDLETTIIRPRLLWGRDDEHFVRSLLAQARNGNLRLVSHGKFLTSTCHVNNACEGIISALRSSKGGMKFFLTDGKPVMFCSFVRCLLLAAGIKNVDTMLRRTIPLWLAQGFARVAEVLGYVFGAYPVLTRAGVGLVGQQMTFSDYKARSELGYAGSFSVKEGYNEIARNPPPLNHRTA